MTANPLVYLAGPITLPDPVANTHDACKVATRLVESGFYTLILPHCSIAWHLVTPRPWEFWLKHDMELIAHCDALLRLPGTSRGADMEVEFATNYNLRNIFVARSEEELWNWRSSTWQVSQIVKEQQQTAL